MEVIFFSHTHWDREWYRSFQDFRIRLADVMERVIGELEAGRLEYFYLDGQTVILEDYFELYPEKKALIKEFTGSKRLFIGPWYVLADEFLVSGESLVRNLLVGINQAKKYGCDEFFGYLPDSFGHNSAMPMILASFNIKNAILWRGAGDGKTEFTWQSPDGSSVLATYLREGYFITGNFDETAEKIRPHSVSDKILLPVGGDHIFIPAQGGKNIKDYLDNLDKFAENLETVTGELRDNSRAPLLPGTLSARLYLKRLNARITWKLSRICEPLQVFLGTNRKQELDYAWKLLLKNHPHDSICGCSVDEVHEENVSRFKQVDQVCNALIERCMPVEQGDRERITVYNLSNYAFTGVVKIRQDVFPRKIMLDTQKAPMSEDMQEQKEHLAYVENIPPFSARCIRPGKAPKPMDITENIINRHAITYRPDVGDTYNYCPKKGEKSLKARILKTEIIEKSSLRNILRVHYRLNTDITTDIITTSGSKRVEFITSWENTLKDHVIQVKFRFPEKIYETVAENTFGLIKRRFNPDYRIEKHMPAEKGRELSTNTAPMQRFVFTQGLGILTEGLPEYGVSGNDLFITILRATGKLSGVSLGTRNLPAGPPLSVPGAQCAGRQTVRYAICEADSPQELFRHADEFMGCTLAEFGEAQSGDFLTINNPDILVYGIKFPEKTDGIITRAVNISDKPQKTGFNSEFIETDSLEEPISGIYGINEEIIFKPGELKTVRLLNSRATRPLQGA